MLTDKQLEVVMHLCNGLTLDEIAKEMHYSLSNVKTHLRAAKSNADAKSTAHLVAIVISRGSLFWTPDGLSTEGGEPIGRAAETGTDEQELAGPHSPT